jgi:hypothetical protein
MLRLPGFSDDLHTKVVRLSHLCDGRLYPKEISWYLFLLEVEWTTVLLKAYRRTGSLEK